VRPRIRD